MTSHDLSAEEGEEAKQLDLKTFTEQDAGGALESEREQEEDVMEGAYASADPEKTCAEIRLSFFSPTKLEACYVKKPPSQATERFHSAIEKHERDMNSEQSLNFRQQLDQRLAKRIEAQGFVDSPNTRDRKYREMQQSIFSKIQAQLSAM